MGNIEDYLKEKKQIVEGLQEISLPKGAKIVDDLAQEIIKFHKMLEAGDSFNMSDLINSSIGALQSKNKKLNISEEELIKIAVIIVETLFNEDTEDDNIDALKYDPKEDDPKFTLIIDQAEEEAGKNLEDYNGHEIGFCYRYWSEIQHILKEKHGIDWKSPAEMNPYMFFIDILS